MAADKILDTLRRNVAGMAQIAGWHAAPLRPDEGRVLVEQLRLLLGNVGSSVIPAFLLAILLVVTLSNPENALALRLWCGAVIVSKLYGAIDARLTLSSRIAPADAPRLVRKLLLIHAVDGAAWGALAWVSLGTTTVSGSILVVAVAAGIAGSSMSLLSPVLPVFITFFTCELAAVASKLWLMGDPAYDALAVASVLYAATLLGKARNSSIAARAAISLRFENVELIDRLRVETEKAQAAHREAEQANLAKSRFLAAASHDLRQPLHAVNLFVEALRHEEDRDRSRAVVEQLGVSAHALGELLNELLDISKLEAGLFKPQLRVIALQEMFDQLEREFRPVAELKGIEIGFVPTGLLVRSDPHMLGRILRNIIANAIRYTDHGAVLVGCRRRAGRAAITVSDTGPGIAPEHQRAIFREFYQLGNPERDRRKGLGLGLAIVDGLCQVLDHPIDLRSRIGHGSTFSVSVPRADGEEAALRESAPEEAPADLRGYAVLVIDDEPAIRQAMEEALTRWHCRVLTAGSAAEAVAEMAAQEFEPDAIVSDYRLREAQTGTEAIAEVRRALGRTVPAAILTGDTAPERLREASESGLLLLHKPLQPSRLRAALTHLRGTGGGETATASASTASSQG